MAPTKEDDYIPYKNVLPNLRTLIEYKQRMAIEAESEAANALYNNPSNVKSTLHYDNTSQSKIDGEWPAIILNFGGNDRYSLRPIFFAYEDRKQITRLIIETLQRLAFLVTTKENQVVTAKVLWEKVMIIMTDSAEKNLHIEDSIALELRSQHKPFIMQITHSHTVEA